MPKPDQRRIKIEHIQSGEHTRVLTLAEAVPWISEQCEAQSADHLNVMHRPDLGDEVIRDA